MQWSGEEAVDVLRFALAVYASSEAGSVRGGPRHRALTPTGPTGPQPETVHRRPGARLLG